MAGVRKFEHAVLRVNDIEKALSFYREGLGLVEITRTDDTVYLGCGLDRNYDLAVKEGGTGLDHFAIRCDTEEEFDSYKRNLKDNHVDYEMLDNLEPGEKRAIRLKLPSSKIAMEFVMVKDSQYQRDNIAVMPSRSPIAPADADHINIFAPDLIGETEFFQKVLGFGLSDVLTTDSGKWGITFVRAGDFQHEIAIGDVAIVGDKNPAYRLHHYAWNAVSFEHMKFLIDRTTSMGVPMEYGPTRQQVGNLSVYFWEPGGNRFEFSTEMAILGEGTPPKIGTIKEGMAFGWGIRPPESFRKGT